VFDHLYLDPRKYNDETGIMNLSKLLRDDNFNMFFSLMVGIGLMCLFRPMCVGKDCTVSKPPSEKDFEKYVYRLGGSCYEFKTEVMECPASGAIEAFQTHHAIETREKGSQFSNRRTPIQKCDSL
jgi:hypothetical protein